MLSFVYEISTSGIVSESCPISWNQLTSLESISFKPLSKPSYLLKTDKTVFIFDDRWLTL